MSLLLSVRDFSVHKTRFYSEKTDEKMLDSVSEESCH